ncbi:DEAD/DEAH box helicase [Novosphingobium sp. BL-8H]|uniref:DEAD/DEAH box helicase n=1 Tax=Novosphingobium sp. BL-8H TaxID=3127640 RepID=UPI0037566E6A
MSHSKTRGETILLLARALREGDLLYLADDEQEAEALADALAALFPCNPVVFLPSSDTLPGDRAPASPANIGRRIAALRHLRSLAQDRQRAHLAAIMSGEAAARLYAAPAAFDAVPPLLCLGETIDTAGFASQMEGLGYVADDRVDEPGEVAVRGDVIDIFPADAGSPARIDVAEGRIAGIRRYDPASQRTDEPLEALEIGRAVEPENAGRSSILDHLVPGQIIMSGKANERRRRFIRLAQDAAGKNAAAIDAVSEVVWARGLASWAEPAPSATYPVPRFAEQPSPMLALRHFAAPLLADGKRLLLVGSERDIRFLRRRIAESLKRDIPTVQSLDDAADLPRGAIAALPAPIDRGGGDEDTVMIAAADILGSRALVGEAPQGAGELLIASGDIRTGDLIVHEDHGVGRVLGLEPAHDGPASEFIALEYAAGSRRLLPAHEAGRLWRYGADGEAVKLDKLDGSSWHERRGTIDLAIAENAGQLLRLAQERRELAAPVIEPEAAAYERFLATFPFNETADQLRAIQAVRDDLSSGSPMDRLVIGDVGYGKTEVALRAAALCALAGYQVILAAPTTVLVRQHLQTFKRRFADTGISIAGLSRLTSASEKKSVKAALADGSVDIVIGTAAVMAKDVRYAKLGLVIIDEEQRFGAADKSRLRGRAEIHLLAMSATPIPRTLHRAMIGLQQISVIATPPARRQPVRTSLANSDDAMIRTALLRERSRGGQSFVVAPQIEDLGPLSQRLARIAPDLVLIEAHGKMPASEMDDAMVRFGDGEGDVLLATNIIEAGLDIPRANTMIVWRADRFGLAQLHQLRGRVGRGNRRGQVILLTEEGEIASRTVKRLRTLATFDQLGAGFEISVADLDQRGAGDPLADTQAGHMKLIGIDLYQRLFEAALEQVQGRDPGLWAPDLNLGEAGGLPAEWIPDPDIRLGLYVRLARLSSESALGAFEEELADRFGPPPAPTERLLATRRIGILARAAGIARIDAGPAAIGLTPRKDRSEMPDGTDLVEQNGRWLLKKETGEADRPSQVAALLETLTLEGD